jgi:hypothetical protein
VPDVFQYKWTPLSEVSSKHRVRRAKSYCNINTEVVPAPVRFAECSLLQHWLRPGKAMLQVPLNFRSLSLDFTVVSAVRNMQKPINTLCGQNAVSEH